MNTPRKIAKTYLLMALFALSVSLKASEEITAKNVAKAPVVNSFLGKTFVVPIVRTPHRYYVLSPNSDSQVTLYTGSILTNDSATQKQKVLKGKMQEIVVTQSSAAAERIIADAPIAVYYADNNRFLAIPPAAQDLWGVHQQSVIGALNNNTQVQIQSSNGELLNVQLNAGEKTIPALSGNAVQDQGSALSIHADQPIGAMTQTSDTSQDVVAFWSQAQLAKNYQLPVAARYLAIVCPEINTQINIATAEPILQTCGDGNSPGKNYVTTDKIDLPLGTKISSEKPIYVIYQSQTDQLRKNLPAARTFPSPTSTPTPASTAALSTAPLSAARLVSTQALVAAAAITYANAANPTSGTLTQNTQWLSGTTYTLSADVTIPVGVSSVVRSGAILDATLANITVQGELIVEAGAILKFGSGRSLSVVSGTLTVSGTSISPVRFTTSAITPNQSSWQGINLTGTSQLTIDNAIIEYAGSGLLYQGNTTGTVSNSNFLNNNFAVYGDNATTQNLIFTSNRFGNNSYAVLLSNGGKPILTNNAFINNTTNVATYNYPIDQPIVMLNFQNNWWGTNDINVIEGKINDQSDNNQARSYIDYRGFLLAEGGIASDATYQLLGDIPANLTLAVNKTYQSLSAVTIPAGVTVTVNGKIQFYDNWDIKGTMLFNNTASVENLSGDTWDVDGVLDIREGVRWSTIREGSININNTGRLTVTGSTAKPVVFTTSALYPSKTSWTGFNLTGNSQININNAVIEYAANGLFYSGNPTGTVSKIKFVNDNFAVYGNNATTENLVFTSNRFENNSYGFFSDKGGKPRFTNNAFIKNTTNVATYNYPIDQPIVLLNFQNNWWGTTDINVIESKIWDQSDDGSARSYIDYRGFLLAEGGVSSDSTYQLLGDIPVNLALAVNKTYQSLGAVTIPAGVTVTVNGKIQSYDNWDIKGTVLFNNTASVENISGDTWNVDGVLDIREGVRWSTIREGSININNTGRLAVTGTSVKPVVFTTSSLYPSQTSWSGINLTGNSQININNAVIEYAGSGLLYSGNPTGTVINTKFLNDSMGVYGYNATTENLVFTNDRFENNTYGVLLSNNGGKPKFNSNAFVNNTINTNTSVYPFDQPIVMLNFQNNWWGTTDINVIESKIYDQSDFSDARSYIDYRGFLLAEGGVATDATHQLLGDISVNTTLSGTYDVLGLITVPAGITFDLTGTFNSYENWDVKGTLILRANTAVSNFSGDQWLVSGVNSKMIMEAGAKWQAMNRASLWITEGANLAVNGTATQPVTFTSAAVVPKRDDWEGITVKNASASINNAVLEWAITPIQADNSNLMLSNSLVQNFYSQGVMLVNNATGTINNNVIDNQDRSGTGINIENASPTIINNRIQNNANGLFLTGNANPNINNNIIAYNNIGLYLNGGGTDATNPHPVIRDNDIVGNIGYTLYLYNYGTTTTPIDFTQNWWGSATPNFATLISTYISNASIVNTTGARTQAVKGSLISGLTLDREYFSPNNDAINETSTLTATQSTTAAWTVEVRSSSNVLMKQFSGSGASISATWDGKNSAGTVVADGIYQLLIKVSPQTVALATRRVIVDKIPPVANIDDALNNKILQNEILLAVNGTANDANLSNYQLQLIPASGAATTLATANAPVLNTLLGNWAVNSNDASMQPTNGAYTLKLITTDRAGNVSTDTAAVTVDALAFAAVSHTPAKINPTLGESATINFSINRPATISLAISPELGGAAIKTLQQTVSSAGSYSFTWDGKNSAGQYVGHEAYSYVLTASSGALTAVYDPPRPPRTSYFSGTFDAQFNSAKNDYWEVSDLNFVQAERVVLEAYPSSGPSFLIAIKVYPTGANQQVFWDGRDPAGNVITGMVSVFLSPKDVLKTNSVIITGNTPILTGGGTAPTIEIMTNPSLVTLTYEQIFSMVYRVDQNAYVSMRLMPPAGSTQVAVTLQNRVLTTALQNGLPKDQNFSWRGYAGADTNNLLIAEEGTYTVEITAESVATGVTTVFRSSVSLYE